MLSRKVDECVSHWSEVEAQLIGQQVLGGNLMRGAVPETSKYTAVVFNGVAAGGAAGGVNGVGAGFNGVAAGGAGFNVVGADGAGVNGVAGGGAGGGGTDVIGAQSRQPANKG